jgi:energy-coupling factor transporter ATP-binding protein EcfA2
MLELLSVQFSYPGQDAPAVIDASLTIAEGEILAVIGRNASGKSTLSRLAAGILRPERGTVRVDGLDTCDERTGRDIRRRVAFLQQNPESQFVSVTVEREIASGPENLGWPASDTRAVVGDMLESFGLVELRKYPPGALSAGQMQKVLLASLLAMKPAYLVLDEPTSYLDPLERRAVGRELSRVSRSLGTSVVWVTQFLEEAAALPRIVAVSEGRICFDGVSSRFLADADTLFRLGIDVAEVEPGSPASLRPR